MNILLLEPYLTGSHAAWARQYAACSRHRLQVLGLPGRHWKWRMHGGAVTLAGMWMESAFPADLILATDMLDLACFQGMTRHLCGRVPSVLYFHENQLTYPWSPRDADPDRQRDAHYAFLNFTSALTAEAVLFNSRYHHDAFFEALPPFLKRFPDCRPTDGIERIREKSRVMHLGLDLRRLDAHRVEKPDAERMPLILWNHRWEYDKNPEAFFAALFELADEGWAFEVAVLGEAFAETPDIFQQARQRLGKRIVHFGYARDFGEYARWLWRADILPVTSIHDFFGISVVEAMYCRTWPLLPRRLAYPEHLPVKWRGQHLYDHADELLERMRSLLADPTILASIDTRCWVEHYDWTRQRSCYDDFFESIIEAFCSSEPYRGKDTFAVGNLL
jgi:glycosyltransferase involved in cell wall biosynthesis